MTKNESKRESVGLHEHNNDERRMNDEKGMPDEPPEGSWWTKVSLGCVLSESIHSCPMEKDKHLAIKKHYIGFRCYH